MAYTTTMSTVQLIIKEPAGWIFVNPWTKNFHTYPNQTQQAGQIDPEALIFAWP